MKCCTVWIKIVQTYAINLVLSYVVCFLMENLVKIWYFYEYFFKNVKIFKHGFYSLTSENMFITSERRGYFENLMKPLVTNENLEELKSFQDELVMK